MSINDFVITVATVNGSGSQSANNILVRSLFRMGLPVGGKNIFPSNIQGLPTWFSIRVNENGFTGRRQLADVVVALNPQTAATDVQMLRSGGWLFLSSETPVPQQGWPDHVHVVKIPFKDIAGTATSSVKLKKLLTNMVYVGVLAELLEVPEATLAKVLTQQFGNKDEVLDPNRKAIAAGRAYAQENLRQLNFPFRAQAREEQLEDRILIDGNTAAAMGLIFGGCTFLAWYPITPSSSLVEAFVEMAANHRRDDQGLSNVAVVQAEDELAAISMVVGAGWTGARAMTATSGPGLSLMAEAAGLAYYAEIPAVIWDVQRVGPSTGLPTRTMQGDLLAAYHLSHGDTQHVVLLPGTTGECFEFGQVALDLAEQLQTLIVVLSDLDLGMNLHVTPRFHYPERPMNRGKVLDADQVEKLAQFQRYKDVDGDGITHRTWPGTRSPKAAYFTRGTGHNESGAYSESSEDYRQNMERLARKHSTAAKLVPVPVRDVQPGSGVGLLYYGSSNESVMEARFLLQEKGVSTSAMRVRALPLHCDIEEFISAHDTVYVIEQNRDAQFMTVLRSELPQYWERCTSILQFDGQPLSAEYVADQIWSQEQEGR